jgi:hypothetical protein
MAWWSWSRCPSLRKSIDRINRASAASTGLQNFIQDQLATKFHRSVRSVSCAPYLDQVPQDSSAHLQCEVRAPTSALGGLGGR